MDRIIYNSETRSFTRIPKVNIPKAKISQMAGKVGRALSGSKASMASVALGLGASAVGMGSGLVGMHQALSDPSFSVVYLDQSGNPKSKTVKAKSPIDAISKIKSKERISKARAFRMPEQDDSSQDYYDSLNRN